LTSEGWIVGEIHDYPPAVTAEEREAFIAFALHEIKGLRSERAYVLEEDGRAWSINGTDDSVSFRRALRTPGDRSTIIHNHPGKTPPSVADLHAANEAVGRCLIVVAGPTLYRLTKVAMASRVDFAVAIREAHQEIKGNLFRLLGPIPETEMAHLFWQEMEPRLDKLGIECEVLIEPWLI